MPRFERVALPSVLICLKVTMYIQPIFLLLHIVQDRVALETKGLNGDLSQ